MYRPEVVKFYLNNINLAETKIEHTFRQKAETTDTLVFIFHYK